MNFKYCLYGVLGALVSILTACTAPKHLSTPVLEIPEHYRKSIAVTGDSVQLPRDMFFKDTLLNTYIDRALQQNKDIQIALKTTDQLELLYKQAKKQLMPTLDLNMSANRSWVSKNSLNGSLTEQFTGNKYLDDYNTSLQLSWEADIWGKAKLQKEASRQTYFAQKKEVQALKTRIIAQVAYAYYNLVALDEQLKIAETNVALSQETVRMMQLQYQAGQINSLAVQQAAAQQKVAELILPKTKQQIAVQEHALSILMGVFPESIARNNNLEQMGVEQSFSEGVPAKLLSHRPDVRAAEHRLNSFDAQTGLANIARYPSFSLTPSIGVNSFTFRNWFDLPGSLIKTLAANLTMPILQKRHLKTAYESALLEQEKAALQFQQTYMIAVGEVSDAMAKAQGAAERMQLIAARTEYLNQSVSMATKLYQSGRVTYLEVLIAQNSRLENDLEYMQTVLEKRQAEVDLFRSLGGSIES